MIKLTVDPGVEQALHEAFPRPAASARKALTKYVKLLELLLLQAHMRGLSPQQRKLGTYGLSLSQLQEQGGRIGPAKLRVHKWLSDHGMALVEVVELGPNLTGLVSEVKLSKWVTLTNTLDIEPQVLKKLLSDQEIDDYLDGDSTCNQALFQALYPDFCTPSTANELEHVYEQQEVDIRSLKAFVVWLSTEANLFSKGQREHMLRQARIVLAVTQVLGGTFIQRKNPSEFGRMYYEGVNIQSVHRELRRAMLGDCWEYDIRSSVVAWKMGFAKSLIDQQSNGASIREVFRATLGYLEDKADFMATVRHYVFLKDSNAPKELQLKLLKQAFTAIGFGAKTAQTGWLNEAGRWENPALMEILKNQDERERFFADLTVQRFIQEQRLLDEYIFELVKAHRPDIASNPCVQNKGGSINRSKVLAYMYQHGETEVMDVVRSVAVSQGREPIACVHDAIFFRRRLGAPRQRQAL